MYYYPEIDSSQPFLSEIKRELISRGHDVTTVVPNPVRDLSKNIILQYAHKELENTENGKIIRLYVNKNSSNSIFQRALRFVIFQIELKKFLKKNIRNYDLIYFMSNPPIFVPLLVERMCHKNNKEMIYEIDDIFPEITGKYKFLEHFAHKAIKNCSHIITLSEDMRKQISKWSSTSNIEVVSIWPPAKKFSRNDLLWAQDYYKKDKFNISYIGNIGHFQNIDILLNVAKKLQNITGIQFLLAGFGRNLKNILKKIEKEKITNIKYIGKLSPEKALACYSLSNLNIISLNKNAINFACPSKTSMCVLANRRTLLLIDNSLYSEKMLKNKNFILNSSYNVSDISNTILDELTNRYKTFDYKTDFRKEIDAWIQIIES